MRIERGTFEQAVERAKAWGEKTFKNHHALPRGPGEWFCARLLPENEWTDGKPTYTGYDSFRLIVRAGYLFWFGDLGDYIIERNGCLNMVAWAAGAVDSPIYLTEKIQAGERECFYLGDAEAELAGELFGDDEDERHVASNVAESLGAQIDAEKGTVELSSDLTPEEWYGAWVEAERDEPPDCIDPSPTALRMMESLRWFCSAVMPWDASVLGTVGR
jgi:hypothetical protein